MTSRERTSNRGLVRDAHRRRGNVAGASAQRYRRARRTGHQAASDASIRSVTIPREVLAITVVLLANFASGCDVVGPSACTLIGCTGLVVEVTGAPSQTPVTVVVTAPDGSTRSSTCTSATGTCPVSFPDFTPASVTIRVLTGTQTTEVTRQPMYEVTRPNGQACPPECRNARMTVVL
jgi:hypothetical protein